MELDLGNSKAQIVTSGPCCNHETINAVGSIPESKDTVNAGVLPGSEYLLPSPVTPKDNSAGAGHAGNDVFKAVAEYIKAGVSLLPCKFDGKDPYIQGGYKGATRDIGQATEWWRRWPQARIGIPTGTENGFFVLDIDIEKGNAQSGAMSLVTLENRFGRLPETYTVRTPSGGEHRYFKMPQGPLRSSVNKIGSRLDIRGDGTYAIAAGSRGYTVLSGRFDEIAEAPEWLIRLCRGELFAGEHAPRRKANASGMVGADGMGLLRVYAHEVKTATKGQRHDTILTKANAAGYLVRDGLVTRAQAISQLRRAVNCHDYTPEEREVEYKTVEDGVLHALESNDTKPPVRGRTAKVCQDLLVDMLHLSYGAGNLASDGGRLFVWRNDGVWRQPPLAELGKRMSELLGKAATLGMIKSAYGLALSKLYTPAFMERKEESIINVQNGEIAWVGDHWKYDPQHKRERYALSQLPVQYDPSATCPVFMEYLETSLGHDNAAMQTRQLLLEMAGYTLLPTCRFQKFAILNGVPGSGKSVFLDLLGELVGEENQIAVMLAETIKDSNRAALQGKLLHTVGDLDSKRAIPIDLLKSLTSGDVVSARALYGAPFNLRPTTALWIGSNSLPRVADFKAIKRRVALIEFTREIPVERQDRHLIEKLKAELPGILNMILDAFAAVLKRGGIFTEPDTTKEVFELWEESSDDLTGFINECCVLGDEYRVSSGELYEAYVAWAKRGNVQFPIPANRLAMKLKEVCRVESCRSGGMRKVRGIKLA